VVKDERNVKRALPLDQQEQPAVAGGH
jgi:hypothetical protein